MKRRSPRAEAWKVLVCGFCDWPRDELETAGFDRWRCTRNPSGRLLIGEWHRGGSPPDATRGELPARLRDVAETADGRPIEWSFRALPVVWGVGRSIAAGRFDVVVVTGLGEVRGRQRLLVEKNAYNRRAALPDAAGATPGETPGIGTTIDLRAGAILAAPDALLARADAVAGPIAGTAFRAHAIRARGGNDYVCNETHQILLARVRGEGRLRQTYLVHLPEPRSDDGIAALVGALAKLVERLIQP